MEDLYLNRLKLDRLHRDYIAHTDRRIFNKPINVSLRERIEKFEKENPLFLSLTEAIELSKKQIKTMEEMKEALRINEVKIHDLEWEKQYG